jgi:hypothetical protein
VILIQPWSSTAKLTDKAHGTFKEMLGVDCPVVTIADSYEQAVELRKKFEELARKLGLAIPH